MKNFISMFVCLSYGNSEQRLENWFCDFLWEFLRVWFRVTEWCGILLARLARNDGKDKQRSAKVLLTTPISMCFEKIMFMRQRN